MSGSSPKPIICSTDFFLTLLNFRRWNVSVDVVVDDLGQSIGRAKEPPTNTSINQDEQFKKKKSWKLHYGKFTLTSTSQKCSTHDDHRRIFGWHDQATSSNLSYRAWQRRRQARYIPTFILAHNASQFDNVNSLCPQSHNVCRTAPWDDHKPHCCQKIIAQWLNDKKVLQCAWLPICMLCPLIFWKTGQYYYVRTGFRQWVTPWHRRKALHRRFLPKDSILSLQPFG